MNDEIRIIPITTKKGLKTFIQFIMISTEAISLPFLFCVSTR